jgi:hypothetical protein
MKYLGIPVVSLYQFVGKIRQNWLPSQSAHMCYPYMIEVQPCYGGNCNEVPIQEVRVLTKEYRKRITTQDILSLYSTRRLFTRLLAHSRQKALGCPVLSDIQEAGTIPLPATHEAIYEALKMLQVKGTALEDLYFVRIAARTYALCNERDYRIAVGDTELLDYSLPDRVIIATFSAATARLSHEPIFVVRVEK